MYRWSERRISAPIPLCNFAESDCGIFSDASGGDVENWALVETKCSNLKNKFNRTTWNHPLESDAVRCWDTDKNHMDNQKTCLCYKLAKTMKKQKLSSRRDETLKIDVVPGGTKWNNMPEVECAHLQKVVSRCSERRIFTTIVWYHCIESDFGLHLLAASGWLWKLSSRRHEMLFFQRKNHSNYLVPPRQTWSGAVLGYR